MANYDIYGACFHLKSLKPQLQRLLDLENDQEYFEKFMIRDLSEEAEEVKEV